jgi:hypothetical protein
MIVNDDPVYASNGGPLDTPTLDASATNSLNATNPSASTNLGTLVSSLLGFTSDGGASDGGAAADDDGDALGIAVTAVDSALGDWQYTLDGTNWQTLAPVPADNGDAQALLLPANSTTAVRFLPAAGYEGTIDDALTFLAWDQAVGAPGTLFDIASGSASAAFSATSAIVPLSVDDPSQPPGVTISGPGTIHAGDAATFTVTLSHASDQTVTVNWMPQDGTAVHPDDWTQGTFTPGYEVYSTQDGYEVTALQTGTQEDGYYYPVYSVDTGYNQTTYSNNDYSVDTGYYAGYDYNSYTVDDGEYEDGYEYNSYTTDGQVLTDGYYYPAYPGGSMQSGFTVTDLWEDQPYQDDSGDWIDNYVDVPVAPFFVATDTPDTVNWAAFQPDSQFVPDGTTVDGYWAPDSSPDTSWPGGYVAQQGYVDGTITVPSQWSPGPQDTSWPGGSYDDPQWIPDLVTVPGQWAPDVTPDPSWPGGYTYDPQWQDTGMLDVLAGTYTADTPDPAWTAGYTTNTTWVDTGPVSYGGYWQQGSVDPTWQGPDPQEQEQWVGSDPSSVSVPFWSPGDTIDPSWASYYSDPQTTDEGWVPAVWSQGGTLTFAPGVTQETVSITTIDDELGGSRFFEVELTGANGATLEDPSSGMATIVESGGGYDVSVLDGYEVYAVQGGTLTDGYDYPVYTVDNGYYQTTYSNTDYSVDTGYWQPGYQYDSYQQDTGYVQDGYDYGSYTTTGPVLTDGYYYLPYTPTTTVYGYTVTDLWEDQPYQDDSGDWIDNYVDVPVTPFFVATSTPDTVDWAQYYPDSQQVADGSPVDGYWQDDAAPDTSWPGGYVAQQGYVDGTITVPGTWAAGPQDASWPGGSTDDPHWIDTGVVTVPGYWAPDTTPDPSWGGTSSYAPQWVDTGMVAVLAGTYTADSPDPAWTTGYTTTQTWIDQGTVTYGGYWEAGPIDPSWQGPTPTDDPQWSGGSSDVQVPFYSAGSSIDPSWTSYSPVYETDWVPATPPAAGAVSASTTVGSTITIGLLSNSSDPQGWSLKVDSVGGGTLGTVTNNGDGTVTYAANSAGTDSFSFTIDDGLNIASGTVVVTVSAPLSGTDLNLACGLDGSIGGSALAALSGGVGTISFQPLSGATSAGGSVTMDNTGAFSYIAPAGFSGGDSFVYSATDGAGETAVGTVYIVVS